jgi:hypothetical protein
VFVVASPPITGWTPAEQFEFEHSEIREVSGAQGGTKILGPIDMKIISYKCKIRGPSI